jgi:predicted Zn finger-like uncharacterized protein
MRLICPNCGAQYEVDAAMIPAKGRDVQCSNCVTTWFQPGAQSDDIGATAPPAQDARPKTPPPPPSPEGRTPRRRETSEEALEIIRQEAAREARMRQAEALETQEEMPLDVPDDAAERGRKARAQIAGLTRPEPETDDDQPSEQADINGMDTPFDPDGPLPETDFESDFDKDFGPERDPARDKTLAPAPQPPRSGTSVAPAAAASRRDLLPDIEEINSTLSPDDEAQDGDAVAISPATARATRHSKGRRVGFVLVLILAIVAVIAYVSAGSLAEALPDAAPAVAAYVEWVNSLRMALHDLFEGFVVRLDGMSQG